MTDDLHHAVENLETSKRAREFALIPRLLMQCKGDILTAKNRAETGYANSSRTITILKSAATAGTTSDTNWANSLVPYRLASNAWCESLAHVGAFDAMLPSMKLVPFKTRVVVVTAAPTAYGTNEAALKVMSSLALTGPYLEPVKATAFLVITDELADNAGAVATALIDSELQQAVALETDTIFFADMVAATTPTPSAGATVANILTDMGVLVAAVTSGRNSRLFHVVDPTNAKKLCTKASTAGGPAFPRMGPNGGVIVEGVTTIVSSGLPSGATLLLDASQIIAGNDIVTFDGSRQADLQFAYPVDSPETSSTVRESLWQTNRRSIRAERYFGYELSRATAVASLSSTTY